jgi:hypothetical protein
MKRLGAALVVLATFTGVTIGLTAAATTATASPSCSIVLPTSVAITSEQTTITAHTASDCTAAGMSSAEWDVMPSNFGDYFIFQSGTISDHYTFYSSIDQVGVLQAKAGGASTDTGFNDIPQNQPYFSVKYGSWVYVQSSRSGRAVYINALVHQWSDFDLAGGVGRTVYLQRYLKGAWQNIAVRTTNSSGRFTIGFVQTTVFQYRLVTTETATEFGAHSASTFR